MWQYEREGRQHAGQLARQRGSDRDTRTCSGVGALLLVVLMAAPLLGETWADDTGNFQIEATFVQLRDDSVYLKKANGKTIKVPLARLSPDSQAQARRLNEAQAPPAKPGDQPAADGDDPAAALQTMTTRIKSGDLRVMWDALPASYQKDVTELVHTFAEHMDAELFQGGATILQKTVQLLQEKKDFLLENPTLAAAPERAQRVATHWDAVVDLLATIVNSELTDLEKLKTLDLEAFFDGTVRTIGEKMAAVSEELEEEDVNLDGFPGVPVAEISKFDPDQISVVDIEGDTATLRIEDKDGKVTDVKLVRVDGKWLPKELVDNWAEKMQEAKTALDVAMKPNLEQAKAAVLPVMGQVENVLDQLLAAATPEDFNAQIMQLMAQFGPMLGAALAEARVEGVEGGKLKIEDGEGKVEEEPGGPEPLEEPAEDGAPPPQDADDDPLPF